MALEAQQMQVDDVSTPALIPLSDSITVSLTNDNHSLKTDNQRDTFSAISKYHDTSALDLALPATPTAA